MEPTAATTPAPAPASAPSSWLPSLSAFSVRTLLRTAAKNSRTVQYSAAILREHMSKVLATGPIPAHIAFIMDGNRRFSKRNNMELRDGHLAGFEALFDLLELCFTVGVTAVSAYAFSLENFNRPDAEVRVLFDIIRDKMMSIPTKNDLSERFGVRISFLGNRAYIPDDILQLIDNIEKETRHYTARALNICFAYTSRDDIAQAIHAVVRKVKNNELAADDIHLSSFMKELYTGSSPPLDMLVRTSGETRLSDFMLWESNQNCTVEFTNTLWPEFGYWELYWMILKWSAAKTRKLRVAKGLRARIDNSTRPSRVKLSELAAAPPAVSVTEVRKNDALLEGERGARKDDAVENTSEEPGASEDQPAGATE